MLLHFESINSIKISITHLPVNLKSKVITSNNIIKIIKQQSIFKILIYSYKIHTMFKTYPSLFVEFFFINQAGIVLKNNNFMMTKV